MEKIVDLRERLEVWKGVFSSDADVLHVSVSNHGRVSLLTRRDKIILDVVSSSNLISSIQNGIDSLCFSKSSD